MTFDRSNEGLPTWLAAHISEHLGLTSTLWGWFMYIGGKKGSRIGHVMLPEDNVHKAFQIMQRFGDASWYRILFVWYPAAMAAMVVLQTSSKHCLVHNVHTEVSGVKVLDRKEGLLEVAPRTAMHWGLSLWKIVDETWHWKAAMLKRSRLAQCFC